MMTLEIASTVDELIPANTTATDPPASEKKPVAKGRKTKEVKDVKKITKKKTVSVAAKKKRTVSTHPTYEEMIKDAIFTLKERTGSSQYAIQKFIEEKRSKDLPPTFRKMLLHNLKRLVASGKLVKVKASFKLPSAASAPAKKKPASVAVSKSKGKVTAASKAKKPLAIKPKTSSKAKSTVATKKKALPAKPKAKERPAKAAKTSKITSPGKKAAASKKKVATVASKKKKKTPVKKVVKPKTVKSPVKRASSRVKK